MAGLGRKTWAADEILAADDLQDYIQDQVVFVYDSAGARTSGILSPTEGMVSYLKDTNLLYVFDGSLWVEVAPDVGTPGTYTKVTTDFKGRVTSGTTLSATDIPNLDAAKTTTGSFATDRIPSLDASKITTGTFNIARIPAIPTTLVNGGTWNGTVDAGVNNVSGRNFNGNDFVGVGGAQFDFGVKSVGVYNRTNTGRAMFVASDGTFGIGASSERFKENIVDSDLSDEILLVKVREFTFKPEFSDDVSVQTGVIAEELVDAGLERFVYFDDDGNVEGVAYERLVLALIPVVQSQAARLDAVESRLSKLEK